MIHHRDEGSGPTVVLLHAGVADLRMWDAQVALLVDHGFRTVRCDLRGFGETGLEPGSSYSDAEDVLALLDHLGVRDFALVGASAGGHVALQVATAAAPRVTRLVLLAPAAEVAEPDERLRALWEEEGRLVDAGDLDAATALNVRAWVGPDADDAARDLVARMQRRALEVQVAAGDDVDARELAVTPEALTMPTTILVGAHDFDFFLATATRPQPPCCRRRRSSSSTGPATCRPSSGPTRPPRWSSTPSGTAEAMPEGDTVWRTALHLDKALTGAVLTETDFRVPAHATLDLSGQRVEATIARGKHLLTRIGPVDGTGHTLHTHLKMEGAWHLYKPDTRWRRPAHEARVVLRTESWTAVGFSLGIVEVVARDAEDTVVGHLGPDLLGPDWDEDEALRRLLADPTRPVADAILDQRNLAGLGNLYKNELCFLAGAHPRLPVGDVPRPPPARTPGPLRPRRQQGARRADA